MGFETYLFLIDYRSKFDLNLIPMGFETTAQCSNKNEQNKFKSYPYGI